MVDNVERLKNNKVLKEIIKDSFGGVMYVQKDKSKYDTKELISIYNLLTSDEKDLLDGVTTGAINYILLEY
jgi:FixJ family two-component response regulator